jgi:hypothetical protein
VTTDDLIRQAVAQGARGITLWPTGSGGWQANVKFGDGFRVAADRDALAALTTALGGNEAPAAEVDLFG